MKPGKADRRADDGAGDIVEELKEHAGIMAENYHMPKFGGLYDRAAELIVELRAQLELASRAQMREISRQRGD